eukprot:9301087-Pyramimonas_sp.AAC.1
MDDAFRGDLWADDRASPTRKEKRRLEEEGGVIQMTNKTLAFRAQHRSRAFMKLFSPLTIAHYTDRAG